MRKGFTLVELSIVLVIIGLLVGGVLVGQSLIDSARVNRLVSDLRQYEVAINLFRSAYRQYPGDSKFFTPTGFTDNHLSFGDIGGDGTRDSNGCNGQISNQEDFQFWAHLSQSRMIDADYPIYSPSICSGGPHEPSEYFLGAYTPYTEFHETSTIDTLNADTQYIRATKASTTNLGLIFLLDPQAGLSLENKMSGQSITLNSGYASGTQVGLTTFYGLHNCLDDEEDDPVECTADNAGYGIYYYYIAD